MIAVFDLGGPLITYALLRSAGMSTVVALVISGIFPALGALGLAVWTLAYGEHEKRKAERLAASA